MIGLKGALARIFFFSLSLSLCHSTSHFLTSRRDRADGRRPLQHRLENDARVIVKAPGQGHVQADGGGRDGEAGQVGVQEGEVGQGGRGGRVFRPQG